MPLCAPGLLAAAQSIIDPHVRAEVSLLGRRDWWKLWYRARGFGDPSLDDRFGTTMPVEHLDIALAVAGHGVAIGSPILFAREIHAGRLVPVLDVAATDGRSFWLAYQTVAEHRAKIANFREWICDEASAAREAAQSFTVAEAALA